MKTLHVDEFTALNDEIRALVAAQIPLPTGLRAASGEYPGRVGAAAGAIAERLETGQSLESALQAECSFNDVYASVVAAGVRAGRLSQALEGVATTARRISSLRRLVLVSLLYPTILVVLAYALFCTLLTQPDFIIADMYPLFGLGESPFAFYTTLKATMPFWIAIPPIAFAGVVVWVVGTLGRGSHFGGWGLRAIRDFIRFGRISEFLNLLQLLVEHETPLAEACELAGRASADRGIRHSGEELAEKLRNGIRMASPKGNDIPPMIQWLILSGADQKMLLSNLRRSAESYGRRTERLGGWMAVYVPLIFSFVLGGGATVLFGCLVLGPWFHFLLRLGASI